MPSVDETARAIGRANEGGAGDSPEVVVSTRIERHREAAGMFCTFEFIAKRGIVV